MSDFAGIDLIDLFSFSQQPFHALRKVAAFIRRHGPALVKLIRHAIQRSQCLSIDLILNARKEVHVTSLPSTPFDRVNRNGESRGQSRSRSRLLTRFETGPASGSFFRLFAHPPPLLDATALPQHEVLEDEFPITSRKRCALGVKRAVADR